MAYSDPYEEWKAGGKQGTYSDWSRSNAQANAPTPAPTQTAPAAPQPAQKQTQGAPGTQGTGSDAAVQQANAAYNSGQRGSDPNAIYGSPQGAQDYRTWYSQQQGGQRPEDLARFSNEVLAQWDQYSIKDGPNAGKYRSMRGEPGFFDKPTECRPGYVPSGPNETDPCIPQSGAGAGGGGGQGGGAGAGGGGGYGGGGGGGFDNPIYQYLSSTGLQAAQDPEQALKNYMGWGGANQFQQQMDQARERVMAMPPGPARDAAAARLEEQKMTQMGNMRQQAGAQARGELQGLLGQEFNWQGQLPFQYAGLNEQARQADMQNQLGWGGLGVQERLGMGNLGLGWAGQNLAQQQFADQTGAGRQWQTGQNALDRKAQLDAINAQAKASKPSTFDRILGVISDIRVKENIEELPSLSKLRDIPVYSYNYTFEPERRRIGVMAQDVERVAPELVDEGPDGLKRVDSYGLTALILSAVKELDDAN